jgi:hypothetical protein
MENNKNRLEQEISRLEKEVAAYRSYHAEKTATEIALILFGICVGLWAGYLIGANQ